MRRVLSKQAIVCIGIVVSAFLGCGDDDRDICSLAALGNPAELPLNGGAHYLMPGRCGASAYVHVVCVDEGGTDVWAVASAEAENEQSSIEVVDDCFWVDIPAPPARALASGVSCTSYYNIWCVSPSGRGSRVRGWRDATFTDDPRQLDADECGAEPLVLREY